MDETLHEVYLANAETQRNTLIAQNNRMIALQEAQLRMAMAHALAAGAGHIDGFAEICKSVGVE